MKRFKIFAIAAACVFSVASIPAFAQSPAKLKKGGGAEADCVYTDLSIVGGILTVNCASDVVYTNGGTPPPAGGPYSLTATVSPTSSGAVTSASCTTGSSGACINGAVPAGAVTLNVSANAGYTFTGWSGVVCAGGQTATACTFTIAGNTSVVATFSSGTTTPPPVVPTGCTGLTPASNYEARASIGGEGQSSYHYGRAGITYSYPLPVTGSGKGLISTTSAPLTPGGINVEISISQCPGDMSYYQTPAAKYVQFGSLQVPCGGIYNPESGGLKWSATTVPWDSVCLTPTTTTTQWYFNIRYNTGCEGGASCPIFYFWNRQ